MAKQLSKNNEKIFCWREKGICFHRETTVPIWTHNDNEYGQIIHSCPPIMDKKLNTLIAPT